MAEDTKGTNPGSEDPIKNIKGEFDRKLGNMEQKMSTLQQTNEQLLAQLKSMSAPKPAPKVDSKLDTVWFDKPEEAAEEIVSRAERRIEEKFAKHAEANARQQSTLANLVSEFPELNSSGHELTKKAIEIYSSLSDEEKRSPIAYKAAVKEAALDLGYKPMAKRSEEEQDFALRGTPSYGNERRATKSNKIDPQVAEFAALLGLDLEKNPEAKKRIVAKHNRRTYNSYE